MFDYFQILKEEYDFEPAATIRPPSRPPSRPLTPWEELSEKEKFLTIRSVLDRIYEEDTAERHEDIPHCGEGWEFHPTTTTFNWLPPKEYIAWIAHEWGERLPDVPPRFRLLKEFFSFLASKVKNHKTLGSPQNPDLGMLMLLWRRSRHYSLNSAGHCSYKTRRFYAKKGVPAYAATNYQRRDSRVGNATFYGRSLPFCGGLDASDARRMIRLPYWCRLVAAQNHNLIHPRREGARFSAVDWRKARDEWRLLGESRTIEKYGERATVWCHYHKRTPKSKFLKENLPQYLIKNFNVKTFQDFDKLTGFLETEKEARGFDTNDPYLRGILGILCVFGGSREAVRWAAHWTERDVCAHDFSFFFDQSKFFSPILKPTTDALGRYLSKWLKKATLRDLQIVVENWMGIHFLEGITEKSPKEIKKLLSVEDYPGAKHEGFSEVAKAAGVPQFDYHEYEARWLAGSRECVFPKPPRFSDGSHTIMLMEKEDPRGLFIGAFAGTNCCQKPWGQASTAAWHSANCVDGGVIVVRPNKQRDAYDLTAQSWIWTAEVEGKKYLVFDSIEGRGRDSADVHRLFVRVAAWYMSQGYEVRFPSDYSEILKDAGGEHGVTPRFCSNILSHPLNDWGDYTYDADCSHQCYLHRPPIGLRTLRESDKDAVCALEREIYHDHWIDGDFSEVAWGESWGVYENEEVKGYLLIEKQQDWQGDLEYYIADIARSDDAPFYSSALIAAWFEEISYQRSCLSSYPKITISGDCRPTSSPLIPMLLRIPGADLISTETSIDPDCGEEITSFEIKIK